MARLPLVEVVTTQRRAFFTAVGLKLSEISYVSIAGVFAISYVTGKLGLPRSVILNALLLSAVMAFVAIPLFGWLSRPDRPQDHVLSRAALFAVVIRLSDVLAVGHEGRARSSPWTIVAAIIFGQIIGFGVGAPWYSELFAARLRYSGASLGFQIGAAISGGLTPFAAASFHGLDRRRDLADFGLPDRARLLLHSWRRLPRPKRPASR